MDINQVIQMGEKIVRPEWALLPEIPPIFIGVGVFLIFAIGIGMVICFGENGLNYTGSIVFLAFLLMVLYSGSNWLEEYKKYRSDISEWKETVVIPYIESLPSENKEIVYIKIDPELSINVRSGWMNYTHFTNVEKTPISIAYKDGEKVVTKTEWLETTMELTDNEKPYIKYQELQQDLGHGINAGIYNATIHLPASYSFTDIK